MTKFLKLRLSNFLSYKTLDLNLEDIAYTSVVGENGSGKSAIPQGIAWIIYGASRFGNSADSIVNDSAKTASGSLTLRDRHNQVWKIERSWTLGKGGGGTLELYQQDASDPDGWVKFGDKLKETAQKQINSIVGLTRDSFYSLVIMDQSKHPGGTAFTATDSNKRREILTSLVPELSIWKELEVNARANAREAAREYESILAKIDQNLEQISASESREKSIKIVLEDLDPKRIAEDEKNLEEKIATIHRAIGAAGAGEAGAIEAKINQAKAEHKLEIKELDEEAESLQREIDKDRDVKKDIAALVNKKSESEKSIENLKDHAEELDEEISEIKSDIAEYTDSIERVKPKLKKSESDLSSNKARLRELNERLEALGEHGDEEGVCWVCGSELSPDKHKNLVTEAVKERDEILQEIDDIEDEIDNLDRKLERAEKSLVHSNDELNKAQNKKSDEARTIKELTATIKELETEIDSLNAAKLSEAEVGKKDKRVRELDDLIEKMEVEFNKVTLRVLQDQLESVKKNNDTEVLSIQLKELERELEEIQFRKEKLVRNQTSLQEAERNTSELNKTSKRLNREAQEKKQRVAVLNKVVHATSPKGIPSILLDSILAAIEDEQNRILASLSGSNPMTVEFTQERENKGEGSKEVLDILVHTSDGSSRLYESFSFGERVRISISNLFAMIKVFNERSGGVVNTLFLDEPLGPLDKSRIPAFIDILRVAMNEGLVDSIFVITHDDRVIEALPQQINVSIDPETKISKIEVN